MGVAYRGSWCEVEGDIGMKENVWKCWKGGEWFDVECDEGPLVCEMFI